MIAVKNLQNLNELLTQEELTQVKTKHFCDMVTDKKIVKILQDINKASVSHHEELMKYMASHQDN